LLPEAAGEHNNIMFPWRHFRSGIILFVLAFSAFTSAQQGAPSQDGQKLPTAAPPANQTSPNPPDAELKVTTRMVVVDVVATDNKGVPVPDLKADDFTVQEEGQEQPVRVFSFHQPDQVANTAAVTPAKLPAGYFSNTPQYKTNGALNVLLLDSMNSTLLNQASMRDAMIKFLEKLPAGQPIAIYLLGNKLTLIQDFTSDPDLLRKAIAGMKRQGSKALDNAAGTTRMADMPVGSVAFATMMDVPQIKARLEEFHDQRTAAQADYRVRFTLDALNSLARSLAGYPGRKNLVWISETFPFFIVLDKITSQNNRDFSRDIANTGNVLSNAQVAIYPVDARALMGNSDYSVGNDPNPIGAPASMTTTLEGETGKNMNREADDRMASRSTMNDLAEKTGGRAFYNTNNIEGAVRHSLEDGSTYYTLGYYPGNKIWDGKFRRITVRVARPGIKLHYRVGYFAIEPQSYAKLDAAQKTDDLARAMSLEFPVSTALLFQAMVVPPSAENKNKVLVNYAVDPHALTFESGTDGLQHASVDCAVIVYSTKGETVQALSNTMVAALKPEEYKRVMQKSFPCRQSLDLAPGQYLFRLGVRDSRTGLIGTLNAPVTITPSSGEAQPAEKKP
jgi:VWFA-related protein